MMALPDEMKAYSAVFTLGSVEMSWVKTLTWMTLTGLQHMLDKGQRDSNLEFPVREDIFTKWSR